MLFWVKIKQAIFFSSKKEWAYRGIFLLLGVKKVFIHYGDIEQTQATCNAAAAKELQVSANQVPTVWSALTEITLDQSLCYIFPGQAVLIMQYGWHPFFSTATFNKD